MFTLNRYTKFIFTAGLATTLACFSAQSIAQESILTEVPQPVEELKTKPKLLSEMSATEKAKLSKEDLQKLKDFEEKMKKLEKPKY